MFLSECQLVWLIFIFTVSITLKTPCLVARLILELDQVTEQRRLTRLPYFTLNIQTVTFSPYHTYPEFWPSLLYYLLMGLKWWMSGKQWRPRSDAAFRGVWSGSALFAQACLYTVRRRACMSGFSVNRRIPGKNRNRISLTVYVLNR